MSPKGSDLQNSLPDFVTLWHQTSLAPIIRQRGKMSQFLNSSLCIADCRRRHHPVDFGNGFLSFEAVNCELMLRNAAR